MCVYVIFYFYGVFVEEGEMCGGYCYLSYERYRLDVVFGDWFRCFWFVFYVCMGVRVE